MTGYDPEAVDPYDSDIECPYCGGTFYYELTRCPHCGQQVYPLEEEEDEADGWGSDQGVYEDLAQRFLPALAVFFGLMVSFVAGTLLFIAGRVIFGDLAAEWPGRGLLLASAPAGAALGGFVGAGIERRAPQRAGWWVGVLSIIAAIVFAAVDRDLAAGGWVASDTLPVWFITVLAGAAGGEFWLRRQRDTVVRQLFPDWQDDVELYEALLARTGRDPDLAERLIEYERRGAPRARRRELIERALERWDRDNR